MSKKNAAYSSLFTLLALAAFGVYFFMSAHPEIESCRVRGNIMAIAGDITGAKLQCSPASNSHFNFEPLEIDILANGSFSGIFNIPVNTKVRLSVIKEGYTKAIEERSLRSDIINVIDDIKISCLHDPLQPGHNRGTMTYPQLVAFNNISMSPTAEIYGINEIEYFTGLKELSSNAQNVNFIPDNHILLTADIKVKDHPALVPVVFTLESQADGCAHLTGPEAYPHLGYKLTNGR